MTTAVKTYAEIWKEAKTAGYAAVEKLRVVPMIVQEHENMLDDNSKVVYQEYVSDGCCGFAWVNIRPASRAGKNDCPIVKWMRENKIGSYSDYDKAWNIWVGEFNQSMQKKETYADAVAEVLRTYGINASSNSRMD